MFPEKFNTILQINQTLFRFVLVRVQNSQVMQIFVIVVQIELHFLQFAFEFLVFHFAGNVWMKVALCELIQLFDQQILRTTVAFLRTIRDQFNFSIINHFPFTGIDVPGEQNRGLIEFSMN